MPGWNESTWFAFLTGVALKSVAVTGAAWLVAYLLRKRSAAARHLVWMAAFAALLIVPVLSIALPAVPVPGTGAVLAPQVVFRADAGGFAVDAAAAVQPGAPLTARPAPRATRPTNWRAVLMLAWAIGALAAFLHMLTGLAYMRRLRVRSRALAAGDLPALAGSLGIRHSVTALETAPGRMPMSFGMLRPAVFMPSDAAAWSEERRRMVLLHELAHVRRGDHAMHLLARAALCFYWWNPLAWLAWRAFLKERERAADDLVLAAGARASDYAAHLLEIARAMRCTPALSAATVAVARRSQLEGRLLAILDSARNRKSPGRAGALAAALICAAVVIPLAALQAQDASQPLPADLDAAIRAALAQRNHETLSNLAVTAEAQRQYGAAQQLLETAVAVRAQDSGPNSPEYGKELVRLAGVEHKRGNPIAVEHYKQAVAILGNNPAAGPALIGLGVASSNVKRFDEAFDYFQRAQVVAPAQAYEAIMWQAIVRERQSRQQEAEPLYKLALSLAPPNSAQPATIMELYAKLLDRQARSTEAAEMREKAAALRKAIPPETAPFVRPKGQTSIDSDGLMAHVSSQMSQATAQGLPAPPPPPPPPGYASGASSTLPSATPIRPVLMVQPDYTEAARKAGVQGTVVLNAEVGVDGIARNITVQSGLGYGLDEKAIEAARQWRFQPGTSDGKPRAGKLAFPIVFRLAGAAAPSETVQSRMPDGMGVPTAPKILYKIEPEYSEAARQAKFQGTVVLKVDVMPDGTAQNISVQRSLGLGLDEKAIESVRKWRFRPGTKFRPETRDLEPVTVTCAIEVNFRLLADPPATASAPAGQAVAGQAVPDNGVFRVGGGVTAPTLLQKIEPEYTEEARLAGYDGTAILYVEIGTDGFPQNIKVTRGLGLGLDEKAIEAVSKWRFTPGTRFGVPVTVAATIEVNFRLL